MSSSVFSSLKKGDSVEKLLQTVQKQNTDRYLYTIENEIYWADSLQEVASEIQVLGEFDTLYDKSGWFMSCQASYRGNKYILVEMKIFSKELHDYLKKTLIAHDYKIEKEMLKKQLNDLHKLYIVIYPRTEIGFDKPYIKFMEMSDFSKDVTLDQGSTYSDTHVDLIGSYKGKKAWMIVSHPNILDVVKNEKRLVITNE